VLRHTSLTTAYVGADKCGTPGTKGRSVTYAAEEAQKRKYPGPSNPINYTTTPTHHPTEVIPTPCIPTSTVVEMEHSLARIDRVTDFVYEPPISTTIHLMEDTGYLLYIDQDRVTLAEMVL